MTSSQAQSLDWSEFLVSVGLGRRCGGKAVKVKVSARCRDQVVAIRMKILLK